MRLLLATAALLFIVAAPSAAAPAWLPPGNLGTEVAEISSIGSVAVAPDGTAVAAWSQAATGGGDFVLQLSRRLPGGAFEAPITVPGTAGAGEVDAAVDGMGNATVTWTQSGAVRAVALPRSGAVGAAETLDTDASGPVIAVGLQGRAVVAWVKGIGAAPVVRSAVRGDAAGDFADAETISFVGDPFGTSGLDVTVGDDNSAAAVWTRDDGPRTVVEVNDRAPNGSFSNSGQSISDTTPGFNALAPTVVIDPGGRTTALWEDSTRGQVSFAERPAGGSWSGPDRASVTGDLAGTPTAGVTSNGTLIAAWVISSSGQGVVEAAIRAPGGGGFTEHRKLSGPAMNIFAPIVAVGRGGDAMFTWTSSMGEAIYTVHRSRLGAYTGVLPAVTKDNPPPNHVLNFQRPDIGVDDQGNGLAVWTRDAFHQMPPLDGKDHYSFQASAFDFAPPALTASVPGGGIAGQPIGMAAAATDRLSAVGLSWAFGDNTSAAGGAVQHAFGAPGAFNVTVTATDAVGNASSIVSPLLVAAAPPPPRVDSTVSVKWGRKGKSVYLVAMRVVGPTPDTSVSLRCNGKKCPFKRKTFTKVRGNAIPMFKELKPRKVVKLKQRRFRAGQTLEVRITAPGRIGRVVRYPIKKKGTPTSRTLCLPLGASTPRTVC